MWRRYGRDMTVLAQHLAFPYAFDQIENHVPGGEWPDAASAVHHWHNKRRERGLRCG